MMRDVQFINNVRVAHFFESLMYAEIHLDPLS